MTDMTDKAIGWVEYQKSLTPDKPFFIHFAPGAVHAPHQVPKEWIDKYRGKFDQGWDKLRDETLARQKQLGVVPPDTKLARSRSLSKTGKRSQPMKSGSLRVRWKSAPVLANIPITRSAG